MLTSNDPTAIADNIVLLTAAMLADRPVSLVYTDLDGIVSLRRVHVQSVSRCLNGQTIVHCWDTLRKGTRKFRLLNIGAVFQPGAEHPQTMAVR